MEGAVTSSVSNTLRGTIKRVVHAPPYQIVTIALDPKSSPEITVAYIPVPGGPSLAGPSDPIASRTHDLSGDGSSGQVTVTIPVPNAVISMGN